MAALGKMIYEFRLERIFQSIKLQELRTLDCIGFRLERIFQSIKLQSR